MIGLRALVCLVSLMVFPASSLLAETNPVQLTVTNQNLAMVTEVRSMTLPAGERQRVGVEDIPSALDPTSLQVRSLTAPSEFRLESSSYQYALINEQNLLNRFIGKELEIAISDPKGSRDSLVMRKATLLANNGRPVFRIGKKIFVGDYAALYLPELPEGLTAKPSLSWLVNNQLKSPQDIEISYLTGGLDWQAHYQLNLNREDDSALFSGWVTLGNRSGKDFLKSEVKLIAGEINIARKPNRPKERVQARTLAMAVSPEQDVMARETPSFEYHLYELPDTVDLPDQQDIQVAFINGRIKAVEKQLVSSSPGWGTYWSRGKGEEAPQPVTVTLRFQNNEENGLGLPLPAGIVRVSHDPATGQAMFVGEDTIEHTPRGAEVKLAVGQAFDLQVMRRQLDFAKVGRNVFRTEWELKVINGKKRPETVFLDESLPEDWRILESSSEYERLSAGKIRFTAPVPGGSEMTVTYRVEITRS